MFIEEDKELYRPLFIYKSKNETKIIKDISQDIHCSKKSVMDYSYSNMNDYINKVLNWSDIKVSNKVISERTILLDTENKNGDHFLCYIFRIISYRDIPNEDNNFWPKNFYEFNYRGYRVCFRSGVNLNDNGVIIYYNNSKADVFKCFNVNSVKEWAVRAFEFIDRYIIDKNI